MVVCLSVFMLSVHLRSLEIDGAELCAVCCSKVRHLLATLKAKDHLAPPGSSWLLLAATGCFWLLLAPPGFITLPSKHDNLEQKQKVALPRTVEIPNQGRIGQAP